MNECGRCHLDFGSVAAFDQHRVGKHEYLFAEGLEMDPPRYDGRRCLGVDELETITDKAGRPLFAQNRRGQWSLRSSLDWAAQARSAEQCTPDGASCGEV